jgi:hypothetical protein
MSVINFKKCYIHSVNHKNQSIFIRHYSTLKTSLSLSALTKTYLSALLLSALLFSSPLSSLASLFTSLVIASVVPFHFALLPPRLSSLHFLSSFSLVSSSSSPSYARLFIFRSGSTHLFTSSCLRFVAVARVGMVCTLSFIS